jgi:hypothetical protein
MHFAIDAEVCAIGIEDNGRIVIETFGALLEQ